MRPDTVHVSATPGPWEMERTGGVFTEQVIRPTGLIDPPVEVRPVSKDGFSQVDDVIAECREVAKHGYRTLVTVLTKKMAEDLTEYMHEQGLRVRYMHSDVDTLERIEIIRDLRLGAFDVLVGINLLREGLDIPECGLVAILDADKEGFLRSETCLIQTIGRAARNIDGRVILYADTHHRLDGAGHGRDQPPAREAGGLQPRARHHAREHQEPDQGHPRQPLRAGDRVTVPVGVAEDVQAVPRRQLQGHPARPRRPDARRRRQPGVRGSRAPARRDQAPEDARPGVRQRRIAGLSQGLAGASHRRLARLIRPGGVTRSPPMKILTLSLIVGAAAAMTGLAPATMVNAQPVEHEVTSPTHGDWTLKQREDWLKERIERSRDDGSLAHSEYDRVRHALDDIRHDEDHMRDHHKGQLTDNENVRLEARLDDLASTIHWLRAENLERPW